MKRVLVVLTTLVGVVVLYGVAIEPRVLLDDVAFDAELPALPEGWDGEALGLVADFQVGMWMDNTGMAEDAPFRTP